MTTAEKIKPEDKFVGVDGLKLRYIEEGSGPSVLFLHGASLGSSADVFLRNLGPFSKAGFRAVAFDYPGFGRSEIPAKQSTAQQRNSIPKFIDAARGAKCEQPPPMPHRPHWAEEAFDDAASLKRFGSVHAALISHSSAGGTRLRSSTRTNEISGILWLRRGDVPKPLQPNK